MKQASFQSHESVDVFESAYLCWLQPPEHLRSWPAIVLLHKVLPRDPERPCAETIRMQKHQGSVVLLEQRAPYSLAPTCHADSWNWAAVVACPDSGSKAALGSKEAGLPGARLAPFQRLLGVARMLSHSLEAHCVDGCLLKKTLGNVEIPNLK